MIVISIVIVLKNLVYIFADKKGEDCSTGNHILIFASIELSIYFTGKILAFHWSKGINCMLVCTLGVIYVKLYLGV